MTKAMPRIKLKGSSESDAKIEKNGEMIKNNKISNSLIMFFCTSLAS